MARAVSNKRFIPGFFFNLGNLHPWCNGYHGSLLVILIKLYIQGEPNVWIHPITVLIANYRKMKLRKPSRK